MIVESIERVYALYPLYREEQIIRTTQAPKTHKEYRELITYRVYNRLGQIEETYQPKIALRA